MKYIQAGGKKRPVHTGSYMLSRFCKANNLTLDQLGNDFENIVASSPDVAISFLYHAFIDGCRVEKKDVDFDEPEVWDWIDQDSTIVTQVYEAFADSLPGKSEATKKKKVAQSR